MLTHSIGINIVCYLRSPDILYLRRVLEGERGYNRCMDVIKGAEAGVYCPARPRSPTSPDDKFYRFT